MNGVFVERRCNGPRIVCVWITLRLWNWMWELALPLVERRTRVYVRCGVLVPRQRFLGYVERRLR